MKDRGDLFAIIALIVAFVVVAGGPPVAQALSTPLGVLGDTSVACDATGDPELIAPSGASSLCIENTSATCVQIGGPTVSTTTGIAIGSGCSGGQVFCADVKRAYCESTAGSVTVDVIFGAQ
jgi:hypothetical protein